MAGSKTTSLLDIETYKSTVITEVVNTVKTITINSRLVIYKIENKIRIKEKKNQFSPEAKDKTSILQGVTTSKLLKNYLKGKCEAAKLDKDFVILTDDQLEALRREGYEYLYNNYDAIDKNTFDRIVEKPELITNLVKTLFDCHMLEDVNGKKLPVGLHFSYIDGYIDNAHYDLKKVFEILNSRPDIIWKSKFGAFEQTENLSFNDVIQDIPYYNADKQRSLCFNFNWTPSVSDYRKMWKKCKSYKSDYPSTERFRAVFDLDLLGIRKAAYFNDYYKSKEYND